MKVVIAGATGRMGRMLVEAVTAAPDLSLSGALDMPSSPGIGTDPAAFLGRSSGVLITADLDAGLSGADDDDRLGHRPILGRPIWHTSPSCPSDRTV